MSMRGGYDAWKTRSPDDTEAIDIDHCEVCPECGGIEGEHVGDCPEVEHEPRCHCDRCEGARETADELNCTRGDDDETEIDF